MYSIYFIEIQPYICRIFVVEIYFCRIFLVELYICRIFLVEIYTCRNIFLQNFICRNFPGISTSKRSTDIQFQKNKRPRKFIRNKESKEIGLEFFRSPTPIIFSFVLQCPQFIFNFFTLALYSSIYILLFKLIMITSIVLLMLKDKHSYIGWRYAYYSIPQRLNYCTHVYEI